MGVPMGGPGEVIHCLPEQNGMMSIARREKAPSANLEPDVARSVSVLNGSRSFKAQVWDTQADFAKVAPNF